MGSQWSSCRIGDLGSNFLFFVISLAAEFWMYCILLNSVSGIPYNRPLGLLLSKWQVIFMHEQVFMLSLYLHVGTFKFCQFYEVPWLQIYTYCQHDTTYMSLIISLIDMCDFQYLPYAKSQSGEAENLIEKILPTAGEDIGYMDREVAPFMLPGTFSRFDRPMNYNYKRDVQPREPAERDEPEFCAKLIQHGRMKRSNHAITVNDVENFKVPAEPHPEAVKNMELQKPGMFLEEVRKVWCTPLFLSLLIKALA